MELQNCKQIIQRLASAGYSQRQIAKEAGVKQPTISRISANDDYDPASSVLIKLHAFACRVLPTPSRRGRPARTSVAQQ